MFLFRSKLAVLAVAGAALAGASLPSFADNTDVYADPYWKPREWRATSARADTPMQLASNSSYDFLTRYNP